MVNPPWWGLIWERRRLIYHWTVSSNLRSRNSKLSDIQCQTEVRPELEKSSGQSSWETNLSGRNEVVDGPGTSVNSKTGNSQLRGQSVYPFLTWPKRFLNVGHNFHFLNWRLFQFRELQSDLDQTSTVREETKWPSTSKTKTQDGSKLN